MKNKFLGYTVLILFLIFVALYYSSNCGLIDYQSRQKRELTEKQIKQFEDDVKNNVNIDIKDYIDKDTDEYDNNLSKATLKLSNTIGKTVERTLNLFFDKIEKMMND